LLLSDACMSESSANRVLRKEDVKRNMLVAVIKILHKYNTHVNNKTKESQPLSVFLYSHSLTDKDIITRVDL
jgi:altronate dehydratase